MVHFKAPTLGETGKNQGIPVSWKNFTIQQQYIYASSAHIHVIYREIHAKICFIHAY
jgi:hypothetical protein